MDQNKAKFNFFLVAVLKDPGHEKGRRRTWNHQKC